MRRGVLPALPHGRGSRVSPIERTSPADPGCPYSGEGARRNGGRFNRIGLPALYLSLSPLTAIREAFPAGRFQPITLCAYEIDAEPIFDAVNPQVREAHGVTDLELSARGWRRSMLSGVIPASQTLADRLVAAGFVGMRVRSFAATAEPGDLNLVFWRWSDRGSSRVVVIDDEGRLLPATGESSPSGSVPPRTEVAREFVRQVVESNTGPPIAWSANDRCMWVDAGLRYSRSCATLVNMEPAEWATTPLVPDAGCGGRQSDFVPERY